MSGDLGVGGRDGPRASLDRVARTNQEIEPGEPKNRGEASVPGLADWLLAGVAVLPAAVGAEQCCLCASVEAREARFSNFLPTLTVLRCSLPTVLPNATSMRPDRRKTPAWRGSWRMVRPALPRVAARTVGPR